METGSEFGLTRSQIDDREFTAASDAIEAVASAYPSRVMTPNVAYLLEEIADEAKHDQQ